MFMGIYWEIQVKKLSANLNGVTSSISVIGKSTLLQKVLKYSISFELCHKSNLVHMTVNSQIRQETPVWDIDYFCHLHYATTNLENFQTVEGNFNLQQNKKLMGEFWNSNINMSFDISPHMTSYNFVIICLFGSMWFHKSICQWK